MRKFTLFLAFLFFMGMQIIQAQDKDISGTITSSDDGQPIPGVQILVKGTQLGVTTNLDGYYELKVPTTAEILVFRYVGMKTQEIEIGTSAKIDMILEPDVFGLDELVVTGVASGTPRKKLSVTVDRVGEERIKEVPALSAAGALQGKIAGVTVVNSNGNPGESPAIRLRGATSLTGSLAPLYIVDGVIIAGDLSDINVDDIESMEVVKGAAGSSLYGSRAGNGVISITTKRGKDLGEGQTLIVTRNEIGFSTLAGEVPRAEHHPYELASDWSEYSLYTKYEGVTYPSDYIGGYSPYVEGNRTFSDDHYADNPYAFSKNHQKDLFENGLFFTNYISLEKNKFPRII
jgi:TonB-dependent SusC/RagA subfamily outer membrane receptor